MGLSGKEKGAAQGGRAPPPSPSPIRTRRGGRPPFSLSPHLRIPIPTRIGGGVLLLVGVGLLLARPKAGRTSPPWLLYIRRQGAPLDTQVDLRDRSLAVCGAPSTIFHLGHIVAVLRRSPAMVEHQDRHHAVVLTELFLDTLLDRSPGIVIELNMC